MSESGKKKTGSPRLPLLAKIYQKREENIIKVIKPRPSVHKTQSLGIDENNFKETNLIVRQIESELILEVSLPESSNEPSVTVLPLIKMASRVISEHSRTSIDF